MCRDEYIICPFSVNNMAVPTRYAALPYRFQLDEYRVRTGLVKNLNTMHEMKNLRVGLTRKWIEQGRVGAEKNTREERRGKGKGSTICICLISFA